MALDRAFSTAQHFRAPYVKNDAGSLLYALVSAPTPAVSTYAPLKAEPNAILERALEQHGVLVRRLEALKVEVASLPAGRSPLATAVADLAIMVAEGAILARPTDLTRAADVGELEALLQQNNIPIVGRIEAPGLLDGGDVLVTDDRIFVGVPTGSGRYARRSNELGREQLAALVNLPLVEVPVDAHFPRLRSVASVVDANTVVLGGEAVAAAPFDGFELVRLPLGEEYAAGVLTLAPRFVLSSLRFQESPAILRKAKIRVEAFDLWELGKLGLSPALLALSLQRR